MNLNTSDFDYILPEEHIAFRPLTERESSKLLVLKGDQIIHSRFENIENFLQSGSILVFNDTKVINSRLIFRKKTGAAIEVFCLEPENTTKEISDQLEQRGSASWKCLVGNKKRWKKGEIIEMETNHFILKCHYEEETNEQVLVNFEWNNDSTFAEILDYAGKTPLPPYIRRQAEDADKATYQTIYASRKGAVAAPTAGLHFSESLISNLKKNGFKTEFLTLHVGAGTFLPVKTGKIEEHKMHSEQVVIKKSFVEMLLTSDNEIVCIGTTSLRTLESIYWFGIKLIQDKDSEFFINQDLPYLVDVQNLPSKKDALRAVSEYFLRNKTDQITGQTSLFIRPGYKFRMCKSLITNFHQPQSSLLMLVSALIGNKWKEVYKNALDNDYRFLSYGDACFFSEDKNFANN